MSGRILPLSPSLPRLQLCGLLMYNFHTSNLPDRITGGRLGPAGLAPFLCSLPHPTFLKLTEPSPTCRKTSLLLGSLRGFVRTSRETQSLWTLPEGQAGFLAWLRYHILCHMAQRGQGLRMQSRNQPIPAFCSPAWKAQPIWTVSWDLVRRFPK